MLLGIYSKQHLFNNALKYLWFVNIKQVNDLRFWSIRYMYDETEIGKINMSSFTTYNKTIIVKEVSFKYFTDWTFLAFLIEGQSRLV